MAGPSNQSQNSVPPTYAERYLFTGQFFSGVADTNTKQILLENPSGSGQIFLIFEPAVSATGQFKVGKRFNPPVDTEGSPADTGITNKSSGGGTSTGSTQIGGDNETGTFSSGDRFNDKSAGGGAGSREPGALIGSGLTNAVEPGDTIVLECTNTSGSAASMSIDIDYLEIPTGQFEKYNQ